MGNFPAAALKNNLYIFRKKIYKKPRAKQKYPIFFRRNGNYANFSVKC